MAQPFAIWVQWIKHPDRFLRFIPKEPDLLQDFPELNLSEPGRVDQKPPTVFEIWIEEMRVQSVRASRKNVLSPPFFRVSVKSA